MTFTPHPFARFIAILGRGRIVALADRGRGRRGDGDDSRRRRAARTARRLSDAAAHEGGKRRGNRRFRQGGAQDLAAPEPGLVDVDWSSYAGKKRQLPWFLLAALCLAQAGHPVFMHGVDGHTPGRLYTGEVLAALGLPGAPDFPTAARRLRQNRFAYMDLAAISPPLARMMGFKPILGLRSPIHTLARMINPFGAPVLLQGVFHPNYMATHRDAAMLLGQNEHHRVPRRGRRDRTPAGNNPARRLACAGVAFEDPLAAEDRRSAQLPDETMDVSRRLTSGAARPRTPMPTRRSPARSP